MDGNGANTQSGIQGEHVPPPSPLLLRWVMIVGITILVIVILYSTIVPIIFDQAISAVVENARTLVQSNDNEEVLMGLTTLSQWATPDQINREQVVGFLQHEDHRIRATAADIISTYRDLKDVDILIPLLEDEHRTVRYNARVAIANIRNGNGIEDNPDAPVWPEGMKRANPGVRSPSR